MPYMVLNTIIYLLRKINLKLIVIYRMTEKKLGETYHDHGMSRQLLKKFKLDILKYFQVCSAPFLLTR